MIFGGGNGGHRLTPFFGGLLREIPAPPPPFILVGMDKIVKNGIVWEVIGRSGSTLRVQHKCTRWEPVIDGKTLGFKTVNVMLVSNILPEEECPKKPRNTT